MAKTFNALVSSYLRNADSLSTIAAELREHFEDPTNRAFVRETCKPVVAAHYGITLVQAYAPRGQIREGVFTFPDGVKGKSAAKRLSEMVNDIVGKTDAQTAPKAPVKVTRDQKAAAVAFLAMFETKAAAIAALKAIKV